MIKVVKQLAIFLDNKPGYLAEMCHDLAKNKINILALTVSDTVDHAVVRIIVNKTPEAIHILEEAGMLVVENDVLSIPLPNKPGVLEKISKKLSNKNLNIEYAYCAAGEHQKKGSLVLRVKDVMRAKQVLDRVQQL